MISQEQDRLARPATFSSFPQAPMYYRGAVAAILVFDITSEPSFNKVKDWIAELRT